MFRYRLHLTDGTELGDASYAMQIQVGMEIHHDGPTKYRVISLIPIDDEDSPYTGMLEVEPV